MDDLVGFFADRIAQQIRQAREAVQEQQRLAASIAAPLPPDSAAPDAGTQSRRGPTPALRARSSPVWATAAAAANAAAEANAAAAAAVPRTRAASIAIAPVTAAPAPIAPGRSSAPPAPRRIPAAAADAFPTRVIDAAARPAATNPLLAAFAGGGSLLGAFVLSEAVAPPVSLRDGPPHRM